MAKGLLKKMLQGRNDVMVLSAGIAAMPGLRATQETINVMAKNGIDVASHLTQRLTNEMVEEADLVLVMERFHKQEILSRVPGASKKVHLLREFGGTHSPDAAEIDIVDPIAKPTEVYESCFQTIREAVEKAVQKI